MEKANKTKVNTTSTEKATKAAEYCYYSKVLKEPFESIADLREAEEAYYAKIKAKEDKENEKKSDAAKVENAFKALNAARKVYKEKLVQLGNEYKEAVAVLDKAYETGKADLQKALDTAEEMYAMALKEYTDKYSNYSLKLKDGDNETTISSQTTSSNKGNLKFSDLFDMLFKY